MIVNKLNYLPLIRLCWGQAAPSAWPWKAALLEERIWTVMVDCLLFSVCRLGFAVVVTVLNGIQWTKPCPGHTCL